MQTRIVAILMICLVALSGATAVSGGVSYTSLDSMNENNVTEVSVNATPTVSNSKQRRQYRLAYVSWKNRIADLRMSAIFKWLRTEYYPSLVSIADAASSGSSGVSFARDSMTIQDAWWDLDETMDMDLHRDSVDDKLTVEELYRILKANKDLLIVADFFSKPTEIHDVDIVAINGPSVQLNIGWFFESARDSNDLEGNYDETCCGFVYNQFKDFNVDDLNYCICCGSEFVLPDARDSFEDALEHLEAACNALLKVKQLGLLYDYDYEQMNGKIAYLEEDVRNAKYRSENDSARDSKKMKYTHYVQNESHFGIDVIEGNTKDELIADLFAHIAAASGYHEITKKEAVESIIDGALEDYQYPDSLSKDLEARDSKCMVVSSQDGDEFGACQVEGSGKYRFVQFRGSQTYPANQIRFKNKDEAIEFLCRSSGNYFWVKEDYYVKSWWNGVDGKLYNSMDAFAVLQSMYNARDSADSDSHTIDLTPSPSAYARMLEVVIRDSPNADDVEWATAELNKMKKQKRRFQFKNDEYMDLTVSCNCGCGYTTRLGGQFPMTLGEESYYCSWIPADENGQTVRDSSLYSSDIKSEQVNGEWKHTFTVDDKKVIMGSPNRGHFKCSVQRKDPVLEITGCHWYGDGDRLPHNIKFNVEALWDNPEYIALGDDYDEDEHWNIEEYLDGQDMVTVTLEHGIHDAQAYLDNGTLEPEIQQAIEEHDGFEIMIDIAQAVRSACYIIYSEQRESIPVARDSAWAECDSNVYGSGSLDILDKKWQDVAEQEIPYDILQSIINFDWGHGYYTIEKEYEGSINIECFNSIDEARNYLYCQLTESSYDGSILGILNYNSRGYNKFRKCSFVSGHDKIHQMLDWQTRDSAWDDEKLSYAIELLSEKDLVKYQEWVDSQDGDWNDDGTISFANANAELDYDMRELRREKLQDDMGYCRETELLLCNLEMHGFTLVGHRPYGDNLIKFNRTIDDEGNMPSNHYDIQNIIYTCINHEDTTLIVNHPSRGDREIGIRLVYGNEFGVLAADYSCPRDYDSKPEWYTALKSACNTDIDSIEEYEAITGSSMEYNMDEWGNMSGKISFSAMTELGYKYKLCPKCLETGHENNSPYCQRYGASLSNGNTGSCIGYPSQEIARDSAEMFRCLVCGSPADEDNYCPLGRIDRTEFHEDDDGDIQRCDNTSKMDARDSAEMAVLIPSRYDENVSARELHPNVNSLNPDGFKWSDEQVAILNDFAWWFQEYENGTKTSRPRMVIESVAGSGKTTLVKELLSIINRFDSATKTIASAFNVHIAKILKDEIKDQQKNGFRGLETLGNSNSVSAGGYDIIRSHLKSQGITNVGMESSVEGKYLVLSKIILAEYFGMISKPDGVKNANVGEVIRIMKEVCEYSQAAKPNYRNQYMKLARDLKKFVEALMGQGFVPTRSKDKDLKEIKRIYGQIALVQGLNDTVLLKMPKNAMFSLARDVLLRSMDTWNSEKEVFPFAWTKNYSFSDCIIARVSGFAESGSFEKARFDSNNLYPLWKTLTRDVWDDNKLKTNMMFDHLSKAGLIWPPRGKESGRPTVSAPSGKPACEVWVKGNQMSVSFRDGLAASSKIDGSRACDFLKYNGIKSQWPRNNLNAGKYNESIVKKLETKFKSAKGGFKLHGDSSADIVIEESRSKVTVSFSDHTWLPIALNLEPSADVKKDMAFVDEIQDLSVAKGSLIRKLIRNDGDSGLVLVGDSRQSIMQFAGADAASMTDNAVASNCVSYPMTICWRGSHEVAHSANRVMSNVLETVQGLWPQTDFPDYLSHKSPSIETWPVGKPMESTGTDRLVPMVKELQEENPDVEIAVLSRVNQPLGAVILDLVSNGISITTPSGKDGIVNSIKPILINKYVEPKSPSQGIGIDMDNTNFKDLRSVRNRLEQVVSWAFNQSMIRNKGDADAAAKDERFVSIEGNAELAEALIELWFKEGVPSSSKHKDFVDWFNNVLLSSSGNPVHVSSVHRFKGGECDVAFILRSAKGKPDKETGECMPREIFMNKSMNDAPENAIAEACIMYVAMTRAKQKNVNLWWEKSGEEEVVIDPTRCVECNALTDKDDHAVCIECNGLLCNEYKPLRGSQGGLLHKGGEFDTTLSCGEFLPRNADDFFDFTSTERSERNKHERYCDSCWENAPRDSVDYRKQLEARDGIDRVYCLVCDKCYQSKDNSPIGFTIRYCCGQETETDQERIDFLVEYSSKPRDSQDDEDLLKEMDEDEICMWENAHEHYIRDSNDIRHELEQAGILPANGATRVCANCDKQAVFDVDTAIGTRSFCSEKCYAEYNGLEVMEDPNFYGMMLITRKPIETVYEVHLWTREYEGKNLGEFDEFFKFKNEESARKLYNQITDYTYKILMQYDGDDGDVLLEYDNHEPHETIDDMIECNFDSNRRDSADFCNTCDAHIDLAGRDMLPFGMCIDCFIAQRREERGVPNPIITDNWPENDPDEEPRDSPVATEYAVLVWDEKPEDYPYLGCIDREFNVETLVEAMKIYEDLTDVFAKELHHYYQYKTHEFESSSNCLMAWDVECGCSSDGILPRDSSEFVTITLEEMDNFLVDAQGFWRLNPDEVGHYSREWVYEYYLDKNSKRKWKDCRIRIYSSIPVSYKWHEINESTDVESLSDPINADRIHHDPKGDDWVRTFDSTKSRGKGKDAIRCILLSGKADGSFSYAYHSKAGRCYRKATPTKRITNWRLNLLKKYEQWIWEEKI